MFHLVMMTLSALILALLALIGVLITLIAGQQRPGLALPGGGQVPPSILWEALRTRAQLGNFIQLSGGYN
jgi:hypothetical protein